MPPLRDWGYHPIFHCLSASRMLSPLNKPVKFRTLQNAKVMQREKQGEVAEKVMLIGKNPLRNSLFLTMCLSDYEVLFCEPLNDVSKHIENIFEELTGHLFKDDDLLFTETTEAAHGQNDV